MTYIILRDTFGNGLTTFSSVGLEVYDKDQLEEAVVAAAQELLDEDGVETMEEYNGDFTISNTIVICEIVEKVGCMSVENYINEVVKQKEDNERKERYELYLKLKEEFRE